MNDQIMVMHKIKKARLKAERLLSRFLPRAMVLIYHRVADLDSDPQRLSVTPENFDKQMEVIAKDYYPISLTEMVDDLKKGRVRDRAVVVTFDDGYEDNYINAHPILEKYDIPATVYVSSSYSGNQREFWWDELDRLILKKQNLPDQIDIELDSVVHHWALSKNRANGTVKQQSPHEVYTELCAWFQKLDAEQIDSAIDQLRQITGDSGEARPGYAPMSIDQLRSLNSSHLIEIGAHTRSHINLAAQTPKRQKDEIEGSKQDLESMLSDRIESFSYPFGTLEHYTDFTVKCVKEAGFSNAIANFTGNVTRLTNPFEIPRRMVRNWDQSLFGNILQQYHSGKRHISEYLE